MLPLPGMCSDIWVDVVSPSRACAALPGDQELRHHSARPPAASTRAPCPCPGLWLRASSSPPQTQGTEAKAGQDVCQTQTLNCLAQPGAHACGSVGGTGSRTHTHTLVQRCLWRRAGHCRVAALGRRFGEVLNSPFRTASAFGGCCRGSSRSHREQPWSEGLSQQCDTAPVVSPNLSQQSCQLTRHPT